MRDAIAQLAALMDAAGCFGRGVTANAAWEGKLLEETLHSCQVFALVGVDLGVCPLKVSMRQHSRRPVSGPGNKNGVQVVLVNQPVEVGVGEALARVGAPMA